MLKFLKFFVFEPKFNTHFLWHSWDLTQMCLTSEDAKETDRIKKKNNS